MVDSRDRSICERRRLQRQNLWNHKPCHSEQSEESAVGRFHGDKCRCFALLRVCDFFGFLAIFEHLTLLLSMALFRNIQKNHALSA